MNLNHVKLFIAVYRSGSFSDVAKDLHIAASSVSRGIATLEQDLGVRLFQRTTRNLSPTEAGERYYCDVAPLIEEFDIAHQNTLNESVHPSGKLRVTVSTSFGQIVIAPLLMAFHKQYPSISIELSLSDNQENIIADQFDIAIRHGSLSDSGYIARKLQDVRYLLVASPDYLAENKSISAPEDIQQHPIITFTYTAFSSKWRFRRGEQECVVPIRPVYTITSASAIKACVENGSGIAILADWAVNKALEEKSLARVLPDWAVAGDHFDSAVWLVYPSRKFMPTKTKVFTEFLLNNIES